MVWFSRPSASSSSRDARPSSKDPASPATSRPVSRHRTDTPSSMTSSSDGMSFKDHRRAFSDPRKRSSVFRTRSRSKTYHHPSASSSSDELRSLSEILAEQPNGKSEGSRWFFTRSKKNHQSESNDNNTNTQSSVPNMPELMIYQTQQDDVPRLHTDGFRHGGRDAHAIAVNNCKRTISRPYNFHHVTHTNPAQFPNMERTSHNELASEFSAVRASQVPDREIRGITVQSISSRKRLRTSNRSSTSASSKTQRTLKSDSPSLHSNTSPNSLSPRNSIVVPPPRISSRQAMTLSFEPGAEQSPRSASSSPNGLLSGTRTPSPDDDEAPHAVTTPDDSAWHLVPPTVSSAGLGLADVPEEDESVHSRRSSIQNLRQTQSLGDMQAMLDHASETREAKTERRSSVRPRSAMTDSPYFPSEFESSLSPNRLSMGVRAIEGCWEDDIDYCYDHALEADCDYDWDRYSDDDRDNASVSAFGGNATLEKSSDPKESPEWSESARAVRPPLLVPSYAPSIDPPSAVSSKSISTASDSIVTPISSRGFHYSSRPLSFASTFRESDGFTLSPTLLIPPEFKNHLLLDSPYEDIVENDKHLLPMFDTVDIPRSPLSQSASQESMIPSRTSSLAKRHRSTNSGSSVPELIPSSKTVREEFDHAAEQLADHIAALNTNEQANEMRRVKSQHQRTRSLAKDVVNQAILRKAASSGNMVDKLLASASSPTAQQSPGGEAENLLAVPQRRSSIRLPSMTASGSATNSSTSSSGATSPSVPTRGSSINTSSSKRHGPTTTAAISSKRSDSPRNIVNEAEAEASSSRIIVPTMPTRAAPPSPQRPEEGGAARFARIPAPAAQAAPPPALQRKRSNSDAKILKSASVAPLPSSTNGHARAASSAVTSSRGNYSIFPSI